MTDQERMALALRTIVVTSREARRGTPVERRESLQARTHELLADLEETVIRDSGDPTILADIERERRRIWEG